MLVNDPLTHPPSIICRRERSTPARWDQRGLATGEGLRVMIGGVGEPGNYKGFKVMNKSITSIGVVNDGG